MPSTPAFYMPAKKPMWSDIAHELAARELSIVTVAEAIRSDLVGR